MLGFNFADWTVRKDMVCVRLGLETVLTVTSQSAQEQHVLGDELLNRLAQLQSGVTDTVTHADRVEQRISGVEEMLKAQTDQLQASQANQMGPFYRSPPPYRKRFLHAESKAGGLIKAPCTEGVGVRVTPYMTTCQPGCSCSCHSPKRSATPVLVQRVLGQLFVEYAGIPLFSPKCDLRTCERSQIPHVSVEYWFPLGVFWSQIVRLSVGYQSNLGPQMELKSLRRVPDTALCVNFALDGNIEGLKDLFRQGLASPRDVSTTRGYSVLRWALYGKQYDTCKFLIHEGADPDYRPLSAHDNNPRNKASDFLLQGGFSTEAVECLKCITQGSDYNEEQNFTSIHKIVLGLSLKSLESEILVHPENINATDTMGRTPLLWAAARGDKQSIITLLSYGADPNTMDVQLSGPVSYAADRDHAVCVRLLLEAGADPDPLIPGGAKVGSPLNCAARNASDPLVLKTLLDFGADIEASGVDGRTSLIHVARTDNASFALLLLGYGANINAMATDGQTPLTTAITYHSHNVLQLLLDRWFEYSQCPRLRGPHLLQIVVQYADLQTMEVIAATDHLKLKYDKDYVLSDFATRLSQRPDVTDKLRLAFEGLLRVINEQPKIGVSAESLMESGLLPCRIDVSEERSDHDESDQSFEDALEGVSLAADDDEEDGECKEGDGDDDDDAIGCQTCLPILR